MVQEFPGRVPVLAMARRRQADSGDKAARSIAARLREQCIAEPSSGTFKLFNMAGQNMSSLKPKMEMARAFIAEARERWEREELDDETLKAEIAPVRVALLVHKSLEFMLQSAEKLLPDDERKITEKDRRKYKNALQLIFWASGTLDQRIEDGGPMLSKRTYPSDPVLRGRFIDSRKSSAVQLHDAVMTGEVKELARRLDVNLLPVKRVIDMPLLEAAFRG